MDTLSKIKNFDLNLLGVFVAIDEHRHVTKAAKVLGITQPALSHALGRLRAQLGDQLFVKSSQGMVPTPKAEQLSAPIRSLLQTFEATVLGVQSFDPRSMQRTFRIHTTDLIECLLLPDLLQILQEQAPDVQIVSRLAEFALPRDELERGNCDIAIAGFFGDLPDGFYQQKLFSDHFEVAFRQDHPRLRSRKTLSIEDFCDERHILVAPGGNLGSRMDELLKKKKKQRQIVVGLNAFMSSAWLVSQSDCLFTGPSRLLQQIARAFPVHIVPLPVQVPSITIVQAWHERNNQDPGHKWFRDHVRKILQE